MDYLLKLLEEDKASAKTSIEIAKLAILYSNRRACYALLSRMFLEWESITGHALKDREKQKVLELYRETMAGEQ